MSEFRPEVLDDPQRLRDSDHGGLLRALATAGAQVRRAIELQTESGIERLRSEQAPRAVLVAVDSHAPYLSNLLAALAGGEAPVLDWRDAALPRWAGAADLLLVASVDGAHPRLAELVAQADRRGLMLAVTAPAGSPVAVAASRHPTADVRHLAGVPARACWWSLAAPALLILDALRLAPTAQLLAQVADRLDEVAENNRPDSDAFVGPAKIIAAELAESVPVIAGIGSLATVAARRVAGALQLLGGSIAMAAALPDDVARVGALLEFAAGDVDFFADRLSESSVKPRLMLIGDDEQPDEGADPLGDQAGRRAASGLAALATSRSIGVSRILTPPGPPLVRFAAAAATGDFAATYLALARGVDPSAPRLGELAH